jgi:NAD(P)-dependent dehydrogenase (short-subunit alcohol dehydrogenase family)
MMRSYERPRVGRSMGVRRVKVGLEVGGSMAVVVITGCSSGIGLEAALAFARRGHTACATMRNVAKAEGLRKRAADEGLDVSVVPLDVTDDASVRSGVADIRDRFGPIDVVVNNAGVGYDGAVETIPMDVARGLMETNFWGAFRMIQAVVPEMRERRSGVVVNVSSLAGRIPGGLYQGIYAASKHGLGAMSESLAGELMPFDVRVVCIEPGFFATEIAANADAVDSGIAGSAYGPDHAWFDAFMRGGVESGADARIVADAIVSAVHDPDTPLHRAVGDDAEMFIAFHEQAGTFERWVEQAIPIVEQAVGPRPKPPTP